MNKLLSIIIPSYNMEKYLPKCLGSLLIDDAELLQLLDVIVVNDGSKDRTSEIAHEFEAKYPGVFRVVDKQNGHYGSCVNAGLAVASGKYVKVLDADDTFETVSLTSFLQHLGAFSVDVVFSAVRLVDGNGSERGVSQYSVPEGRVFGIDELSEAPDFISMHGTTYRTELLRAIQYKQIEGIPYSDGEWCYVPMASARTCYAFPHVIYNYLVGREGQSIDASTQVRNFDCTIKVLDHAVAQVNKQSLKIDVGNARYLQNWTFKYFCMLYQIILFKYPVAMVPDRLLQFDAYVEKILPERYEEFGECYSIIKKHFKYLLACRRSRIHCIVIIMFVRAYSKIVHKLKKMGR